MDGAPDAGEARAAGTATVTDDALDAKDPIAALDPIPPPGDDAPWVGALNEARRSDRLAALADVARLHADAYPDRWEPRWILAEIDARTGDDVAAVESHALAAHAAATASADDRGVAWAALLLARVERERDAGAAETRLREAASAAKRVGSWNVEGAALNGLAGLLKARGDLGGAIETYEAAEETWSVTRNRRAVASMAINRAVLWLDLGNAGAAEPILLGVVEEFADANSARDARFAASASTDLGHLNRIRGDLAQAEAWYARSFGEHADVGAAIGMAAVKLARDDLAEAERWARLGVEGARDDRDAAYARAHLAEILAESGRAEAAAVEADAALAAALRASDLEAEWMSLRARGRADAVSGRRVRAIEMYERAIARLESKGRSVRDGGLRFLVERVEPYADLAHVRAASSGGSGLADAAREDALRVAELVATTHARAFREEGGGQAGEGNEGEERRALDVSAVAARLKPGAVIVGYLLGSRRGAVVAIRRDRVLAHPIDDTRPIIEAARAYRRAVLRPLRSAQARLDADREIARTRELGARFAKLALEPVSAALEGAERVYVVPDRDLALVPFASLPWPPSAARDARGTLASAFDVAYALTIGVPESVAPSPPILLAGDPLADRDGRFPALPRATSELAAIERAWGASETHVLRRGTLRGERLDALALERFGVVHFATHAEASIHDPRACAIRLSEGERYGLDRIGAARWGRSIVVLSACRTGEGELVPGQGVVGLSWAFFDAGASAVVASLWSVSDDAAADVMAAFHRELAAGTETEVALARALREAAARYPHPVDWAAFAPILRTAPVSR